MTGKDFLTRLQDGFVAGDGDLSMRLLQLCPGAGRECLALLNLTQTNEVRKAHVEFIEAGAELITTNTLDANAVVLGRHGKASQVEAINAKGVELAKADARGDVCVAGAIGPLGLTLDDDWDLDTYRDAYRRQITALLNAGVSVLQFKFFTNLAALRLAIGEARTIGGNDVAIIAQAVFNDGGLLDSGQDAAQVAASLIERGADVVGAHCGRGTSGTVNAIKAMVKAAGKTPLCAYPNAGFPESDRGEMVYLASADYMGQTANLLARLGVRLIGGCCGASAEAVRAMSMALGTVRARPLDRTATVEVAPYVPTVASFKNGRLLAALPERLPIIAEIDPPPHLLMESMFADVRHVAEAGADAISMAENPLASLKVSNVATASLLMQQVSLPMICHVTCRDRNLLGLQTDLLGAHLLGIHGILAITGDPVPRHGAAGKGVFDVHSPGLVNLLAQLNRGMTSAGKSLKQETDFSVGVAFNSATRNMEGEIARYEKKLAEGARFVMTQPVFDREHALRILDATRRPGVKVFLGFFPLISARTALYLHNEVPGIQIPEHVLQRLTSTEDPQKQQQHGEEQAMALIDALLPDLDGVYLISPHSTNRAAVLSRLIQHIRQAPAHQQDRSPTR